MNGGLSSYGCIHVYGYNRTNIPACVCVGLIVYIQNIYIFTIRLYVCRIFYYLFFLLSLSLSLSCPLSYTLSVPTTDDCVTFIKWILVKRLPRKKKTRKRSLNRCWLAFHVCENLAIPYVHLHSNCLCSLTHSYMFRIFYLFAIKFLVDWFCC